MIGASVGCAFSALAAEAILDATVAGTALGGPVGAGLALIGALGVFALCTYSGQKIAESFGANHDRIQRDDIQNKINKLEKELDNYIKDYNDVLKNININC